MKNLLIALLCFAAVIGSAPVTAQAPAFADPIHDAALVVKLIDDRLAIMPEVAAWKWRAGQPITDLERERQVLERSVADAEALGLDGAGARHFFDVQIRMARAVQAQAIAGWKNANAQPPAGRDLNRELRPALDKLGGELLVAMYVVSAELAHALQADSVSTSLDQLKRYSGVEAAHIAELRTALLAVRIVKAPTVQVIKAVGVLRVGTTGDYAPFSNDHDGVLRGFDIQLAADLAKHWGVSLKLVRTTWPTLMDDFQRQRFDLAMSGISVTPERAARADFSAAYHVDGKTPIARCADARKFATLEQIDRSGVRVIVNPGGTNERFVRERIKRAAIVVHADNRTIFDELLAGHADAMFTDGIEVELQTRRHPQLCGTMQAPLTQAAKGIMLPRATDIAAEVDGWLAPQLSRGEVRDRLQRAVREAY
jgi:cyclohexadienyl dehydratase